MDTSSSGTACEGAVWLRRKLAADGSVALAVARSSYSPEDVRIEDGGLLAAVKAAQRVTALSIRDDALSPAEVGAVFEEVERRQQTIALELRWMLRNCAEMLKMATGLMASGCVHSFTLMRTEAGIEFARRLSAAVLHPNLRDLHVATSTDFGDTGATMLALAINYSSKTLVSVRIDDSGVTDFGINMLRGTAPLCPSLQQCSVDNVDLINKPVAVARAVRVTPVRVRLARAQPAQVARKK